MRPSLSLVYKLHSMLDVIALDMVTLTAERVLHT